MRFCLYPTVRLLREELQLLQEPGSYVGEVIKVDREAYQAMYRGHGRPDHVAGQDSNLWQLPSVAPLAQAAARDVYHR